MVPMRLCQKGMWLNAARAVTVPRSMLSVCVAVGRRRTTRSEPSATSVDCGTELGAIYNILGQQRPVDNS